MSGAEEFAQAHAQAIEYDSPRLYTISQERRVPSVDMQDYPRLYSLDPSRRTDPYCSRLTAAPATAHPTKNHEGPPYERGDLSKRDASFEDSHAICSLCPDRIMRRRDRQRR